MSLEDALGIIARRGQLISALPRGSMLAVMADAAAVERFVSDSVSIAAINAPGFCVLSGPDAEWLKLRPNSRPPRWQVAGCIPRMHFTPP